jgi:hypothetical protein
MNQDDKDFLLHLYDKLWENMGRKEGRLWSYLSIYGAALALSLGVGQYAGTQNYSVLIALALTVWAVLIVVNANWWYVRNRLMVTQIEKRFGDVATAGVIPKVYQNATFQFDRLYRGSTIILSAIALLLFLRTTWQVEAAGQMSDPNSAISVALFYSFLLISIAYCVQQNDSYIASFYDTKRLLLSESTGTDLAKLDAQIQEERTRAKGDFSWGLSGVVSCILVALMFDIAFVPSAWRASIILAGLGVLSQVGSIFVLQRIVAGSSSSDRNTRTRSARAQWWTLALVLAMLSSAAILYDLYPKGRSNAETVSGSLASMDKQLEEMRAQLEQLHAQNLVLEQRFLNARLSDYLTREEAAERYLRVEDAKRDYVKQGSLPSDAPVGPTDKRR